MQVRFLHKNRKSETPFVPLSWPRLANPVVVADRYFLYRYPSIGAIRRVTPVEEYRQWRRQPTIGCMFARLIAIQPAKYNQIIECVPHASTSARVADNVAKRIDALVVDKSVAAAALLFPEINSIEEIARVMLALDGHPSWSVTPTAIDNEVVGKMVALKVVRQIPFGAGSRPSEALVLGNFQSFPPTRKSPIPAMELFVGEPMATDPKTGDPTEKANLAHIDARTILGNGPYDDVWNKSVTGRAEMLGNKADNRAKAKVSLVISLSLARRLGCEP